MTPKDNPVTDQKLTTRNDLEEEKDAPLQKHGSAEPKTRSFTQRETGEVKPFSPEEVSEPDRKRKKMA
jgi:hypothetical protein